MLDTHHHLWSYNASEYDWIPEESPLAQDQLLPELEAATAQTGVTGTIVVQARQIIEESYALLNIADQSSLIRGVVGWVPLIEKDVEAQLEQLSSKDKFLGVRHVLQEEDDDFFLRDDFHRGLSKLPSFNLVYDLLIYQRQLPVSLELVDKQQNLEFIIDHIAKPEITPGRIEPEWRKAMKELAQRDHVRGIKFSGIATEFPNHEPIDHDTVKAYFEETLEIFGAKRLMLGTDWPVCLLRLPSYHQWIETLQSLVGTLSSDEQSQITKSNGEIIYHLKS